MDRSKSTILLLACFLLAICALGKNQDESPSPDTLLSRARLVEETWPEGTPPTSIRAELQVLDSNGHLVQGEYTFDWASASRWKEVIRIGPYERVRIGDPKGYWQKNTLSYEPEPGFMFDKLLHIKEALKLGPKETLTKVKSHEKDGVRQNCTEVKRQSGTDRILCFDAANGALLSIDYAENENILPPQISRTEYSAFTPVAGKLIPYEIRAMQGRKAVLSVKILDISKIVGENPARFNVPANAQFWASCSDEHEAELANRIQPQYPARARSNGEQGRVIFYAVIEADGSLSHLTLIHRASPDLEASTLEAVRHWRYKPPTCGQTPLRVETSISVEFALGQ